MKSEHLTEALLEMHFHAALMGLFEEHFGRKVFRVLKPSQRREALLGFDQGWVETELTLGRFRKELEDAIGSGSNSLDQKFVAYFLQFKRVEQVGKSKAMPDSFTAPYLRAALDLKPNSKTKRSQHETLLRLQQIAGCDVNYACAMVLDEEALYEKPDLDDLRIVPVSDAPTGYATNERHFICFRDRADASPVWCSDPVGGRSTTPADWISLEKGIARHTAGSLLELLTRLAQATEEVDVFAGRVIVPPLLTIVEFGHSIESNPTRRSSLRI